MAKKIKSVKKEKSKNYQTRTPEKTLRSKGYFYSQKREKADGSISWRIIFESWRDGKKKLEIIPKSMYQELGVKLDATHEQVKQALKDYNKIRRKEIKVSHSQIKALKRFEEMKSYNKTFFPPEYVEEFLNRLMSASDGKPRFKKRLVRNFQIVQEMVVELNILPHHYEQDLDRFISYFKEKKYSASYSKDVLWVLNKWGHFYSRKRQTFFEPVGRLRVKTQNSITTAQKEKGGVRKVSKPMTAELLKQLRSKINTDKLEELHKYHWVFISFVFGLRPSECDSALKEKKIETINGVPTLVIIQTKLTTVDDDEKIKRIPIICEEQAEALELIKKGQAKRPTPKWLAEHFKENKLSSDAEQTNDELREEIKKLSGEVFDLYCGRKGFTDFMISKGQSLENISMFLGHKSIQTSWKFYKDRKRVDFDPTDFTESKYPKSKKRA